MGEIKMYYLGTGTEFLKAQCKQYKTLDGALKAAAKDESLVVWDEDGNIIGSLTDNVPEGALDEHLDGEKQDGDDTEQGKDDEKEAEGTDESPAQENGENKANTTSEEKENEHPEEKSNPAAGITDEQVERFAVTVVCAGSLRLRRSASWDNSNECGRASKGQRYVGKRLFMLDGLPMLETIDEIFLSAAAEHVQIDKVES